ncbi:MAG TPA: dihydropteroate synthase [Methylophilaceae bacterium]|nr:dihydropteroate synthase [Methylophilaceae bacterium]
MTETLLFLTGKLAEKSLHQVIHEVQANPNIPKFKYRVEQMGVSVAALMTPALIARRLKTIGDANKMILPGLCQGDLSPLQVQFGIPVERGPEDLKDLPQYFGQQGIAPDLSQHQVNIFAEIVDAPDLTLEAILAKAYHFQAQGADVIDIGCLPGKPFVHLSDTVKMLKAAGFQVSVDSMNSEDLLLAGQSGADYLLSLSEKTLWIADEVNSTPILIPAKPANMASLYRAIECCLKKNRPFIADPILDPIHFGFTDSIIRYRRLRKKYASIPIMMGVGNLTELTDADTTGINAVLFGIISELNINAVLATSVSTHATNAIAEADMARKMMFRAKQDNRLPRGYTGALLSLHDRKPFPYSSDEIQALASQIKDPSFRIMASEAGVHIYNRDGVNVGNDPFALYPTLGVENDASHAFYLGVELARAQIAWQLKKRYVQDEQLNWGVNSQPREQQIKISHREASLKEKLDQKNDI